MSAFFDRRVSRLIWPVAALVVGFLFVLAGAGLAAMYVFSAIVERVGEPDQSLIFWYLPILFVGIMAVFAGFVVAAVGYVGVRKASSGQVSEPGHDGQDGAHDGEPLGG